MIKSWEELGDHLAEIENRFLYLEHSQNSQQTEERDGPLSVEPEWTKKQWETVSQLRSMVLYLQEKVNKVSDRKTVDKQYTIE